ncbi:MULTISPECIES: STAS domain-containing protein [Marichromatium]|uniref:RsbT co-antagonist protein RsbR n=1 Tax=Marichromatium gracile TaxID=1048 RepID=A0A4R4AJS2_MARGR|nr:MULTISPECIES: STAS domain-containing protein [Marichromatium]MBK1710546.1 anti-anti-sigma factor [Marichromatium gracile]MBO8085492.1 STAS domain-containing protein [Marichromatium sp.]RNE92241.1 STAS domain-containing protein [Marichromatium sp. AB31]TCW39631.1 rsbT co-antagonist protein RsbR [Marichromatium gracile]
MTNALGHLLQDQRNTLFTAWLEQIRAMLPSSSSLTSTAPTPPGHHLRTIFDGILDTLEQSPSEDFTLGATDPLTDHLRQLVSDQARHGGSANETIAMLLALKRLITARSITSGTPPEVDGLLWLDRVFDGLTLSTFDAFVEVREQIITQQSLSLLELSTPVLRLWNRILLLPLVGVIDTIRARQVTERLLEAIAHHEARVTIIDLTGVPILDTSVAQHLMKTIDAARLLGTRIVMTGISPEGAQTLTKLGIRFDDVLSRATLRAGIAEALQLIGLRIGPIEDRHP